MGFPALLDLEPEFNPYPCEVQVRECRGGFELITIEVLFFEGCPNHEATLKLAREVVADLGVNADVHEVEVERPGDAETLRFLGSPSVRVNGRDIEPGAEDRAGFALSCRIYGASGVPRREWMVAALEDA